MAKKLFFGKRGQFCKTYVNIGPKVFEPVHFIQKYILTPVFMHRFHGRIQSGSGSRFNPSFLKFLRKIVVLPVLNVFLSIFIQVCHSLKLCKKKKKI